MSPYKVFFKEDGPFALADTPEEAAALMKALGVSGPASLPIVGIFPEATPDAIRKFWKELNENGKRFLSLLAQYPNGVKGERLSSELELPPEKFGGVLGGASKIARKHNLDFGQLVISEMKSEGTQRYRWLCPGPLLLRYSDEIPAFVRRIVASIEGGKTAVK